MISIKQLNAISVETVYEVFVKAFSDYVEPIYLSYHQFKYMIERRGCNLNLSFGAFDDDKLIGFTLNGIGEWNGHLTAYDTGTGIIKEFRQKGIASKMFNESLPVLRDNHITQYLLEVIHTNKPAFDLYRKSGFEVTREFDYYILSKDKIEIQESKLNKEFHIKEIDNPNWAQFKTFWDFEPSWQNSIDSINRKNDCFKILGILDKNHIAGYGIIEKHSGDIPHLAIAKEYRMKGLATTLFKNLVDWSDGNEIKIINPDANYNPFKKFANSINLPPGIGQYEMLLEL
jgi:ribosomal protein S18 acetylase RimI-like enzyme